MIPLQGNSPADKLAGLDPTQPDYATRCIDVLLAAARTAGATDVHLQPSSTALDVKFRIDGVLATVANVPIAVAENVVSRLKVLAGLLTYHTDRPQEGRIRLPQDDVEMRVCTFPTLHGERAVVRLFGGAARFQHLADLGIPDDVLPKLRALLTETSGAILVSGPAGSGKTTTAYACLREIAQQTNGGRNLMSIEDPVEAAIDGVAQSQVNRNVGLDLSASLRFLMRQDPEVILVGEIRDRATAEAALQASLSGHLLLSTFHAGSAAETIGRLFDLGIEPYALRSGVLAIVHQRLLRQLCSCAKPTNDSKAKLGLEVDHVMTPVGCPACNGAGYCGRFLLSETLLLSNDEVARIVLSSSNVPTIERMACEAGMIDRWQRATQAINEGRTSPAEVRRVLGFS